MTTEVIQLWIRRKKQRGNAQRKLMSGAALLGGLFVLFLTFWLTYVVIWIGERGVSAISDLAAGKRFHLTHGVRLICCGAFLVLLFVQHLRTPTEYWNEYEHRDHPTTPGFAAATGMIGGLGVMLAYPGASANMVAGVLLIGPRLITGAWGLWQQAGQLKSLDAEGCAPLLRFLYGRHNAVPYAELSSAGWDDWLPQLRALEGVRFLQKGLMLSTELRAELNQLPPK